MVDSADPDRVDESSSILRELLVKPELLGTPVLVLANKQDLMGALSSHDIESRLGLEPSGSARAVHTVGTNALDGDGIESGILWLMDKA